MRDELLNELICIQCKGGLEVISFESVQPVRNGILVCKACHVLYPIINYIPVMFGYETRVENDFVQKHSERIGDCAPGYTLPHGTPCPGEAFVQRSFSTQWEELDIDEELQYNYSDDDLLHIAKVQLGLDKAWFGDKRVLNCGCGAGKEAIMLQRASGTMVFAFDLNFSLLRLGERVKDYPQIHFFLASVWNLPLREKRFDYVYSHGVLHHTYSTERAVKTLAQYVKPGGYYYFWIYGIRPARKFRHAFTMPVQERIVRPVISRLSGMPQKFALFPFAVRTHIANLRRYRRGDLLHKPTWRNSWLMASDYFTPLFAHWHSMGEAILWLKELGFDEITPLELEKMPKRYLHVWLHNVGLRSRRLDANGSDLA
jgi:SAM-dependent methyltransferase/uncharacterized protein YbaR (Trm112 family)